MPRGVSRLDEARLQGRLWTPRVLNPQFWLDAKDLSTITIATGVSEWRDKSGFDRHVSQANSSLQPAYQPQGFRFSPAIFFNGTTTHLFRTSAFMASLGAISVFAAMQPGTTMAATLNFAMAEGLTTNGDPIYGPLVNFSGGGFRDQGFYTRGAGGTFNLNLFASGYTNTPRIVSFIDNGTNSVFGCIDGVAGTPQSYTRTTSFAMDRFCLGGLLRSSFALPMQVAFSEIVIVQGAVPQNIRFLVEGYLAWSCGGQLAANHPYVNRPPLIGD
jgi:hypothetical protein